MMRPFRSICLLSTPPCRARAFTVANVLLIDTALQIAADFLYIRDRSLSLVFAAERSYACRVSQALPWVRSGP